MNAATEASSCAKLFASEISWLNYSAIARGFSPQQLNYFEEIHSDIQKLEVIKQNFLQRAIQDYKNGRITDTRQKRRNQIVWAK